MSLVLEALYDKAEALNLPTEGLTAAHAEVSFELLLAFDAEIRTLSSSQDAILLASAIRSALGVLSRWYGDGGQVIFRDVK